MGATYSRVKTWISGEILTASDLNSEFDNILNNFDFLGIDDASADVTAMRANTSPGTVGSESLATDGLGELQRTRYVLKNRDVLSQWYVVPTVVTKTTTYTATQDDDTVLGDATGGAFSITLPSASGLTNKKLFFKKIDSSVNAVTIDGDSSEEIDGELTYELSAQYDSLVVISDGTNWQVALAYPSRRGVVNQEVFTSSGTFTVPATVTSVTLSGVGGGGGGGGASATGAGNGGGGGASGQVIADYAITGLTPGSDIAVTINPAATGGAGGGGTGGNGGTGGTVALAGHITLAGGGGGTGGTGAGGAGGTIRGVGGGNGGTGGTDGGAAGSIGGAGLSFNGGSAGASGLGGGGGGGNTYVTGGAGGAGGGANGEAGAAGSDYGAAGGGGGGASSTGGAGGNGFKGILIIQW